jgi:hypothetical protein
MTTIYNQITQWNDEIVVVSIDPGKKNLAIRIELRYSKQQCIPVTLFMQRVSFDGDDKYKTYLSIKNYFDSLDDYLKYASLFVIEKQLPVNYEILRISQHIITLIMIKYPSAMIVEIDPKQKSKLFDVKYLNSKGLKKWSIETAIALLNNRNDQVAQSIIKSEKKKDDLCDTILQSEAACHLIGLTYNI